MNAEELNQFIGPEILGKQQRKRVMERLNNYSILQNILRSSQGQNQVQRKNLAL